VIWLQQEEIIMADTIKINRAPVLTLWGVIVAERLGYKHDEALTLGKALAGLNAQSKGQRLGIYSPSENELEKKRAEISKERKPGDSLLIEVVGRPIPAVQTDHGIRATTKGEEIDPKSVERYLEKKFGESLPDVQAALEALAQAYPPQELEQRAYKLYEQFRPGVPEGTPGWGASGDLDLQRIRRLAKKD
jgi:hypothetical protein